MTEDDYQQWVDASRPLNTGRKDRDFSHITCIRVSNNRYAKDATLEDRLTIEDSQMLRDMGIAL